MTDEELDFIISDMEKLLGILPNLEHSPITFRYYVQLYKYLKSLGH